MCSVRILLERNPVCLRGLCSLLSGSHIDIQVSGPAHRHFRGHGAVFDCQRTGCDLKHGRAGLHGNLVGSLFQILCRYRDESRRVKCLFCGSLLAGMDELIQERTGINTVTAENPASVVALGTGQYREVMNEFESQF